MFTTLDICFKCHMVFYVIVVVFLMTLPMELFLVRSTADYCNKVMYTIHPNIYL
jgi:hypothetical protein